MGEVHAKQALGWSSTPSTIYKCQDLKSHHWRVGDRWVPWLPVQPALSSRVSRVQLLKNDAEVDLWPLCAYAHTCAHKSADSYEHAPA